MNIHISQALEGSIKNRQYIKKKLFDIILVGWMNSRLTGGGNFFFVI
jgi:hypothetical protein